MNRRQTAGQILPLLAVCLGALMGFGGVAVDVGFLQYKYQAQQLATDAAATGGAEVLAHSGCTNSSAAFTAAGVDAASNGYTNGSGGVKVTIKTPPDSGPYANNTCAVSVKVDTASVTTYFTRLFGYASGMEETTSAVAQSAQFASAIPCIYLLSPTTNVNWHGANVQAPNCAIYMNDTANFNAATVNAAAIGEVDYSGSNNNGTFTQATPAPMLPIADPCPSIPGCNYLASNPPSTSSCSDLEVPKQTVTINSGCYNDINANQSNVTIAPGALVVMNGTSNFNKATIVGNGVTLYVTASGTPPNFNGTTATLSPPTSGNMTGVTYYQVPANTQSANFNGTSSTYGGLLYSPTATSVNYNGSASVYTVVVFGSANFNNSAPQDFSTPAPNQEVISKAVIVQ